MVRARLCKLQKGALDSQPQVMIRVLWLLPPLIWLSSILALSVPDEGYSRNASCTSTINIYHFY
jgi:hypothetical protein